MKGGACQAHGAPDGMPTMTIAQLTFWSIAGAGSVGLTALFYPAVDKHADSSRDAFLAALMAGTLCATTMAWPISAVINALVSSLG